MEAKQAKILDNIKKVLPVLDEDEENKLLNGSEALALLADVRKSKAIACSHCKPGIHSNGSTTPASP